MIVLSIAIIIVMIVIVIWAISTQRKLVVLDESVKNTMNQIGIQLSGHFDVLMVLLNMTKYYTENESELLMEIIKSGRYDITAKAKPEDVLYQERIIIEIIRRIAIMEEQYPQLKENQYYVKTKNAAEVFKGMVRTSRMIYNDSVSKMNCTIRKIPVSVIARMLGFQQREYLEEYKPMNDIRKNILSVELY